MMLWPDHSEPETDSFAQADIIRKEHIGGEDDIHAEMQGVLDFCLSFTGDLQDIQLDFLIDGPIHTFRHGKDIGRQDIFKECDLFFQAGNVPVGFEIDLVEPDPVFYPVMEHPFTDLEGVLVHQEFFDGNHMFLLTEIKVPVRLFKELMDLIHPVFDTIDSRVVPDAFVLDQGIAV